MVGPLDSLSDSCYTHTLSLAMYSPLLQRASFCHFLPAFSSFLLTSLPHSLCSLFLSHSPPPSHRIFLFHPWPFLFIGSLIFLALTLLSAELSSSKLLHLSPLSLAWPFLSVSFFLPPPLGSLKNIKKSLCLSFLFLSLSGLCVVPFLSVYVFLCLTDHPVGPFARLY